MIRKLIVALAALVAVAVQAQGATLNSFTTDTSISGSEHVIGYETAVAGGERKFLLSDVKTFANGGQINVSENRNVATLAGNVALSSDQNAALGKSWQLLDPDAATREITLPAPGSTGVQRYVVVNTGTAATDILRFTGPTPDVDVRAGFRADCVWTGSAWEVTTDSFITAIHVTVVSPNDLADSERDALWVWRNQQPTSFIVTGWAGISDTDDTTLNIEEIDGDGANNATVDAVEIATNGTGLFYGSDTTITAGTVETGHLLVIDFDDTDAPGQVQITVYGYYE